MDIKIDITALLGHLNPRGSRLNRNSDNLDVLRASQSQTDKPSFFLMTPLMLLLMNLHPPEICDRKNKVEELTWKTDSCQELLTTYLEFSATTTTSGEKSSIHHAFIQKKHVQQSVP